MVLLKVQTLSDNLVHPIRIPNHPLQAFVLWPGPQPCGFPPHEDKLSRRPRVASLVTSRESPSKFHDIKSQSSRVGVYQPESLCLACLCSYILSPCALLSLDRRVQGVSVPFFWGRATAIWSCVSCHWLPLVSKVFGEEVHTRQRCGALECFVSFLRYQGFEMSSSLGCAPRISWKVRD